MTPPLAGQMIGGWELILLLLIVLILFGFKKLPELDRRLSRNNDSVSSREFFIMCMASGFGFGEIPFAPGTFGSLMGILWFGLLVAAGSFWLFAAGIVISFFFSVWICGEAEKILKQKDPSSVVLDEIVAIPICFAAWVILLWHKKGEFPVLADFFSENARFATVAVFAAFRFFDIAKPWPVRQSQSFPGGWGVTVDDVLAAVYVNLCTLLVWHFC